MSAQQTLMEPAADTSSTRTPADLGLISVVVPVVERADDLVAVYQAFRARARCSLARVRVPLRLRRPFDALGPAGGAGAGERRRPDSAVCPRVR